MDELGSLFQKLLASSTPDEMIQAELKGLTLEEFSEKIRGMCGSIEVLAEGPSEPEEVEGRSISYGFNSTAFESSYTPYHVAPVGVSGIGDAYNLTEDYKQRLAEIKAQAKDVYDENGEIRTQTIDKTDRTNYGSGTPLKMSEEDTIESLIGKYITLYAELHKGDDVPVAKLFSIIGEEKQKKAEALHKAYVEKHKVVYGKSYDGMLKESDSSTFNYWRGV
jgi:hypothetical protein